MYRIIYYIHYEGDEELFFFFAEGNTKGRGDFVPLE